MSSDDQSDLQQLKSAAEERRAAFGELFKLLSITPRPAWATPVLVLLGLVSSAAETTGIFMIIMFLYAVMGHADSASGMFGALSQGLMQLSGSGNGASFTLAAIIFGLIVSRSLVAFGYDLLGTHVSERISEATRNRLHYQYLVTNYEDFASRDQAKLLETLNTDSWLVAGAYVAYTKVIIGVCSIAVFALVLSLLSLNIAIVAAVGAAAIAGVLRWISSPTHQRGEKAEELHSSLGYQMLITVTGMRTIRAFAQERVHQERFEKYSRQVREISMKMHRTTALLEPVTDIGYLGILCAILALASGGPDLVGTVVLAVALLYRMQPYVNSVANNLLYVVQVQSQLATVRETLQANERNLTVDGDETISSLQSEIKFIGVSFKYRGSTTKALNKASFTIPVGRTTAIVGASGAGKSTIVNLLLRLYEPSAGKIVVDGVPLNDLRREDWLHQLAVAGQDVNLIEGTIIDNIRLADSTATDRQVREVCRAAGVSEFVTPLPQKYQTWIGQQGMNFSGGQRQRMGLARALLRNPNLLILDEAMNALDRNREEKIRDAIRHRYAKRTVLLITHRLETVLSADHAICLSAGKVVAEGPPEALLNAENSVLKSWLQGGSELQDPPENEDDGYNGTPPPDAKAAE